MNKGLKFFAPAAAVIVGLLASCGSSVPTSEGPATVTLKAAHGYVASYVAKAATTTPRVAPQQVQTDVDYVGVLMDEDGTIIDLKLDVMQIKVTGADANTTTLLSSVFTDTTDIKSKWDLLEAYNMNGAKGEWYEQALALEQYAIGKNIETLTDELLAGEGDFSADVSITVDAFGEALEVALLENNFHTFEIDESEVAGLKLGIGMSSSHAAKQTNVNLATAVFNGKTIVSAEADCLQIPYTLTEVTGETTTFDVGINTTKAQVDEVNSQILSKVTILEDYGMDGAAGEYFEQIADLETYLIGKTLVAAFEASILTNGEHGLVFTDGATVGVTIGLNDYIALFDEVELCSR
ncbi:MAG: hypothetical protein WC399_04435 [Bacilli bacterium]|jgi:hypothetical protein